MGLDLTKLKNVCAGREKTVARCPACAEEGHDNKGDHLAIFPDGRFACVVHPGESGHDHRSRIAQLVGDGADGGEADGRNVLSFRRRKINRESRILLAIGADFLQTCCSDEAE